VRTVRKQTQTTLKPKTVKIIHEPNFIFQQKRLKKKQTGAYMGAFCNCVFFNLLNNMGL
jgi:hypothetical protein